MPVGGGRKTQTQRQGGGCRKEKGTAGNEEQEVKGKEGSGCSRRMRGPAGSAGAKKVVSEAWINLVLKP